MPLRIDCHVHAVGRGGDFEDPGAGIFFQKPHHPDPLVPLLQDLVEWDLIGQGARPDVNGMVPTEEYFSLVARWLTDSAELDAVVLLAMDAAVDLDGRPSETDTELLVSNEFLAEKVTTLNAQLSRAGSPKRFLLGASVNPNRADWREKLAYVVNGTEAVLVKIIPSAQGIDITDRRHGSFWKALAEAGLPLLCHVGPEYTFSAGRRQERLDRVDNLRAVLVSSDATVIAAHCATPVFGWHDYDDFDALLELMREFNTPNLVRLYADTSALSISTRTHYLRKVQRTVPPEWLVHGSDFPVPIDGLAQMPLLQPGITLREYVELCATKNPLDRDVRIKRAVDYAERVLSNATAVLRLPKGSGLRGTGPLS